MKNVYILGATGSIGLQTIDVILKHTDKFKVVGISLGFSNKDKHYEIIDSLKPEIVCLREKDLKYEKDFPRVKFVSGDEGLISLVNYPKKGIVVNGISGSAGLVPTVAAIKSKKDIALANKETLVTAGHLIKKLIKEYEVKLIPIDSEHNALMNALIGEDIKNVKSLIITASGGAFRDYNKEELKNVTVKDALKHPNWQMGPKITVDSATMMNKGLEVIEAHYLFDMDYDKIKAVLHKESIVHGIVTFNDGSVKAVLAKPDMRMPILGALSYPKRLESGIEEIDFTSLNLSFYPLSFEKYPLLKAAYDAGKKGGLYPTVLNAANEAAVNLFIKEKISFLEIEEIVIKVLKEFKDNVSNPTLEEIIETDKKIKEEVYSLC